MSSTFGEASGIKGIWDAVGSHLEVDGSGVTQFPVQWDAVYNHMRLSVQVHTALHKYTVLIIISRVHRDQTSTEFLHGEIANCY